MSAENDDRNPAPGGRAESRPDKELGTGPDGVPADAHENVLPGAGATLWTRVVEAAAQGDAAALESLARQYWRPLYFYVRHKLSSAEDAEDAVQAFFAERVISSSLVARADRRRGSFRALLRRVMQQFLIDGWRREGAEKRGGKLERVPLAEAEEAFERAGAGGVGEEEAFDLGWVEQVMEEALGQLEPEAPELVRYLREQGAGRTLEELAEEMGGSAGALRARLYRLRNEKLPALLRAVVREQSHGSPTELAEGWDVLCRYVPGLRLATGT